MIEYNDILRKEKNMKGQEKENNMEFIKSIIKNRKLVIQLGKNDFRNKFASTSLGAIWGFLQPFIFMLTYVIVFQYILKTGSSR